MQEKGTWTGLLASNLYGRVRKRLLAQRLRRRMKAEHCLFLAAIELQLTQRGTLQTRARQQIQSSEWMGPRQLINHRPIIASSCSLREHRVSDNFSTFGVSTPKRKSPPLRASHAAAMQPCQLEGKPCLAGRLGRKRKVSGLRRLSFSLSRAYEMSGWFPRRSIHRGPSLPPLSCLMKRPTKGS